MKAMLLAAGLGTRLKPWTDKHPKALAIVNHKSLLQHNIEYLQQYGIKDVIVNVHHFADQIIEAIHQSNGWNSNITISDETNEVLETGGGLKKANWYFKDEENFLLMNVDILTDLNLYDLIQQHQQANNLATLAVSNRTSSRYFLFDENKNLCGWENVNTGERKITRNAETMTQLAFSGIHCISTKIFPLIKQQGKFSMVDVYLDLSKEHNIGYYNHSDSKFIDVGKPESIAKAEVLFP
ncbi:nucleotidyltransferase [Arachidicoccus ginsenosidimutans]|uniref:nucleotidyltransferase family protein n=1 Tax=Arachidicoccus sp. BS20 TaxID=1850526 RepID=UPI0007F0CFEC|nr:nucleotidyltransferase family protein [Arachidicoccus sp. BS20]ANI88722.1 nucleotidyltransferase [Arachidicoccus sp. BS20]